MKEKKRKLFQQNHRFLDSEGKREGTVKNKEDFGGFGYEENL